ncbi:MAG: cyanase [Actinomycetota bacterium]|nr:cyanase [Actinomycetota bacterium]
MERKVITERILEAKRAQGLTFGEIAQHLGTDPAWTTAAIHGQHPFAAQQAAELCRLLGLPPELIGSLEEIPMRGALTPDPPRDPTIYRLHEIVEVYGTTIKALIHEQFGDGIMSAINFNLAVERHESDGEERVRIVLDGKFLPYKW